MLPGEGKITDTRERTQLWPAQHGRQAWVQPAAEQR